MHQGSSLSRSSRCCSSSHCCTAPFVIRVRCESNRNPRPHSTLPRPLVLGTFLFIGQTSSRPNPTTLQPASCSSCSSSFSRTLLAVGKCKFVWSWEHFCTQLNCVLLGTQLVVLIGLLGVYPAHFIYTHSASWQSKGTLLDNRQ